MASPFPGMDPFLENPALWPDVHAELIADLRAQLNQLVLPRYYVRIEERVYVTDEDESVRTSLVPDIHVTPRAGSAGHAQGATFPIDWAADEATPVAVTTLMDEEVRQRRLHIVDRESRRIVTVLEILSPSNKAPGSRGSESVRQKRQEVLRSSSHWVEIDLLRGGVRQVVEQPLPLCDYLVHVSKSEQRPGGWLWPIQLTQRLPTVEIPLLPDDPAVRLDLQQVFDAAYDRARYDAELDYAQDPVPPLNEASARWADDLLRAKGLR